MCQSHLTWQVILRRKATRLLKMKIIVKTETELENCTAFEKRHKHLCWSLFFVKSQALAPKETSTQVFS